MLMFVSDKIDIDMNLYQALLLSLLLLAVNSTFVNTTDFWRKKLNITELAY
jgi:hypothetical protein